MGDFVEYCWYFFYIVSSVWLLMLVGGVLVDILLCFVV